ncbi:hypothetical protein [Pseudomonas aeruginosa]|uniref:hypothetical protein n=2 Tax=Pseudomonas aeruginosa TaxID=287 RepID=UPI00117AECBA|nr:hypothetical protein [Pseudomonas aeruginosa]
MGIYRRYAAAFLAFTFFLSSEVSYSATRKSVTVPSASVVARGGGSPSVSGPSLKIPGQPGVEYIPRSGGGASGVPIKIIPTIDFSIPRTIKGSVSSLKGGIAGIAATAAMSMALDSIGGFIDENGKPVKKVSDAPNGAVAGTYYFRNGISFGPNKLEPRYGLTREQACEYKITKGNDCLIELNGYSAYTVISVLRCKPGVWFNLATGKCDSLWKPGEHIESLTDPDYDDITDSLSGVVDPNWLKDLLTATCEGSLNPAACYDQMSETTHLSGPSSVNGPKTSTTTTTTNPDGTTSTTTKDTQTKYEIKYGDNYIDYTETTTTTTTKDGDKTEETTTTDTDDVTAEIPPKRKRRRVVVLRTPNFQKLSRSMSKKYEDGLEGVWRDKRAEFEDTEFMKFLQGFIPSFSGRCPAFGLDMNIASWANYGYQQFGSICYVLDFVKAILMVSALFLCRALIFGG